MTRPLLIVSSLLLVTSCRESDGTMEESQLDTKVDAAVEGSAEGDSGAPAKSCSCDFADSCSVRNGDPCVEGMSCDIGDVPCGASDWTFSRRCFCGEDLRVVCENGKCPPQDGGDAKVDSDSASPASSCTCSGSGHCSVREGDPCVKGMSCDIGDIPCGTSDWTYGFGCHCGPDLRVVCDSGKCPEHDSGEQLDAGNEDTD